MSKEAAHKSTPPVRGDSSQSNRAVFVAAVADMSWRMALAVLVPIIGGYYLDKAAGTSPVLLIVGFLLAMAGTFVVMRRAFNTQVSVGGKR